MGENLFHLKSEFKPTGDQPGAIDALCKGIERGERRLILQGVTGSGKTFTLANAIQRLGRPVLVISHNKTLAAQLFTELKSFFPENAVEYFISYYDYYQPEAYIPQTDTYIEKDASINEEIERYRLAATNALIGRRDVIVVASVSCIYGLGEPEEYRDLAVKIERGAKMERAELAERLVEAQYARNDMAFTPGVFRVRGDTVDIFPAYETKAIRVEFFGDEVDAISELDPLTGRRGAGMPAAVVTPARQFVMGRDRFEAAFGRIRAELDERLKFFEGAKKYIEAQRIRERTEYDIEMMRELGYCSGIENYSMHLSARQPGMRPYCLFDFFPEDFLTVIDESHVTLPQLQAMFKADRQRKQVLVDHGFRLPSALENRPLNFDEFTAVCGDTIYISATPGDYELERSGGAVEQVVRPTGLLDPRIEIRPLENQLDDVIAEIRECAARHERVLVTTLTKKSSERLADYLSECGIRASYIHSELDALERVRVLNKLRDGDFDCLIGINLLREGLDLPEVALVAILDADKTGFLRSERSLVQTAGRAARNSDGRVILYADEVTPAMKGLIDQTARRRRKQERYNAEHHIVPHTVKKEKKLTISEIIGAKPKHGKRGSSKLPDLAGNMITSDGAADLDRLDLPETEVEALVKELTGEMLSAAEALEFERAALLRDRIRQLQRDRADTGK